MKEYVFTLYGRRHAARQKTPEGKPLSALYNTDTVHAPRRKTPEGNPLSALYNTDAVHTPRRKTPEGKPLSALLQHRHRSRSAAENAGRQSPLRTLQHRHRSRTAAETSDSGYNSTLCKHHPHTTEKAAYDGMAAPTPRNLRRPLITPKNTAVFIGFFFYTSPRYAAESPCFRHKHSLRPKYFFAARITICFTIIDFPSCFFFAAAV